MERSTNGRSSGISLGASWLGLDSDQLTELIGRRLTDLGATMTSESPERTVFRLDATAGSRLRRTGLTIRNVRLVSMNKPRLDRNRELIASNRKWIEATRAAVAIRSAAL
jgi:hypothetical protein